TSAISAMIPPTRASLASIPASPGTTTPSSVSTARMTARARIGLRSCSTICRIHPPSFAGHQRMFCGVCHLPPPYVGYFAAQEVEICRHHVYARMQRGDSFTGRLPLTGCCATCLPRCHVRGTCGNCCRQDCGRPGNQLCAHADHVSHTWHVALALSSGTGVGP